MSFVYKSVLNDYRLSLFWPYLTSFCEEHDRKLKLPMGCANNNDNRQINKTIRVYTIVPIALLPMSTPSSY